MSSDPHVGADDPPVVAEPNGATLPPGQASDVTFTRAGALWVSLILGLLILTVLLIFITQNTESAAIAFLRWRWDLPLGVAMLLSAVLGGLITALVSAARMFQLRRAAKKNLRAALKR